MRTKRALTAVFALLAVSIILLTPVTALAHDPLQKTHEQRGHHGTSRSPVSERVDLAAIRTMVIAFRETGDDRHLDQAWDALTPLLSVANPDAETLIVASFVTQSRHQFKAAIALIRQSLAINARNDEAWLLLASIQLVLGNAGEASDACYQLRNVPTLVKLSCNARVALLSGDHLVAYDRMTRILQALDTGGMPRETLAWVYSVAGDVAVAAGQQREARSLYRRSLTLAERTQVRSSLVDVLLQEGDLGAAAIALDHGSLALPLLVRRLIVARRQGQLDAEQRTLQKVQGEFNQWIAAEDWLHAREMTRFFVDVVDKPALARQLALINIELQQEPEDRRLEERTRPRAQIVSFSVASHQ